MKQPDILGEDEWEEWLPELHWLLRYYTRDGGAFSDTPEAPSPSMRSYLRNARFFPGRTERAMHDIDLLLNPPPDADAVDYSDWVAYYAEMIHPSGARNWQDCVRSMVPHLAAYVPPSANSAPQAPTSKTEWHEFLPNLEILLGGSFYLDALETEGFSDHDEVLDDYVSHAAPDEIEAVVRETDALLNLNLDGDTLHRVVVKDFGAEEHGPEDTADWLRHIAERLSRHLTEIGYRREPGTLSSAYPPHDIRAKL